MYKNGWEKYTPTVYCWLPSGQGEKKELDWANAYSTLEPY